MIKITRTFGLKFTVLGVLYFSQGLPFGFFIQALPVILRQNGFSLSTIGLTWMLTLPWALKFLWAPLVDRYFSLRIGRRKSWLIPLQVSAVALLLSLSLTGNNLIASLPVLMTVIFFLNLIAATQDIATDGLAVDMLEARERGMANGLQVAAYRVGMIVGGGALLIFYEQLGPSLVFLIMAGLLAIASLPVLMVNEQVLVTGVDNEGSKKGAGVHLPGVHFFRREGVIAVLAIVLFYKLGDGLATGMLRPFLIDVANLSLADIGWLLGTVGFIAGLLGALLGGVFTNLLGRKTSLMFCGILQALSIAGYAWLAAAKPSAEELYMLLCGVEHLVGGMATVSLFTCMMDWCSSKSSATDYTVQASAVVISTSLASAVSGFVAQAIGYYAHFGLSAVLSVGALLVVWYYFPSQKAQTLLRKADLMY